VGRRDGFTQGAWEVALGALLLGSIADRVGGPNCVMLSGARCLIAAGLRWGSLRRRRHDRICGQVRGLEPDPAFWRTGGNCATLCASLNTEAEHRVGQKHEQGQGPQNIGPATQYGSDAGDLDSRHTGCARPFFCTGRTVERLSSLLSRAPRRAPRKNDQCPAPIGVAREKQRLLFSRRCPTYEAGRLLRPDTSVRVSLHSANTLRDLKAARRPALAELRSGRLR